MDLFDNGLIPTYKDDDRIAVNTRDLHEFLGSNRKYGNWWTQRSTKCGYIEGRDFVTNLLPNAGGERGRGRSRADHIVSLDVAKEIAMMENSDKGREVRRYFIDVEKRYREAMQLSAFNLPPNYQTALRLLADQTDRNEQQALQIEAHIKQLQLQEPAVVFTETVLEASDTILMRDMAHVLTNKFNIRIGQNQLFKLLRSWKILNPGNDPYQAYLNRKYFKVIEGTHMEGFEPVLHRTTRVTSKGQVYIANRVRKALTGGDDFPA